MASITQSVLRSVLRPNRVGAPETVGIVVLVMLIVGLSGATTPILALAAIAPILIASAVVFPGPTLVLSGLLPLSLGVVEDKTWWWVIGGTSLVLIFVAAGHALPVASRRERNWFVGLMGLGLLTMIMEYPGRAMHADGALSVVAGIAFGCAWAGGAILVRPSMPNILQAAVVIGLCFSGATLIGPGFRVTRTSPVLGDDANFVGLAIVVGLIALLSLLILAWNSSGSISPTKALLALPIGVFLAFGLAQTESRGAFIALAGGLLAAAWPVIRKHGVKGFLVAGIIVGCLVIAFATPELRDAAGGIDRTREDFGESPRGRILGLKSAWHFIVQNPLFGIGAARPATAGVDAGLLPWPIAPHNVFVGFAADFGLPVMFALCAVIVCAVLARTSVTTLLLPLVITFVIGGFAIHWNVDLKLSAPFWLTIGTMLAWKNVAAPTIDLTENQKATSFQRHHVG